MSSLVDSHAAGHSRYQVFFAGKVVRVKMKIDLVKLRKLISVSDLKKIIRRIV